MKYQIKVHPLGNDPSFRYVASTHPTVGEMIYYRDRRYKVVEVGHVLRTSFDGNGETNSLDQVELIVTQQ
jgi:signal peptidase I